MNNPPWLALLEAHSQAHEAWWFAFGLNEKGIMNTPPPDPQAAPHGGRHRLIAEQAPEQSDGGGIVDYGKPQGGKCKLCNGQLYKACNHAACYFLKESGAAPSGQWQPIETAPNDAEVLFWIRPKTAEETYHTSYGEASARICKFKRWGILETATHWMPLPAAPAMLGSHQPKDPAS